MLLLLICYFIVCAHAKIVSLRGLELDFVAKGDVTIEKFYYYYEPMIDRHESDHSVYIHTSSALKQLMLDKTTISHVMLYMLDGTTVNHTLTRCGIWWYSFYNSIDDDAHRQLDWRFILDIPSSRGEWKCVYFHVRDNEHQSISICAVNSVDDCNSVPAYRCNDYNNCFLYSQVEHSSFDNLFRMIYHCKDHPQFMLSSMRIRDGIRYYFSPLDAIKLHCLNGTCIGWK